MWMDGDDRWCCAPPAPCLLDIMLLTNHSLRASYLQRFRLRLERVFMKILRFGVSLLLFGYASMVLAQTAAPAKDQAPPASTESLVVDVHSSPYRSTINYRTNVGDQRFDMRDATLLDMISLAYKRENAAVLGGPTWIDFDRFDVVAKISSLKASHPTAGLMNPPEAENPYDQIRPVLERVLTERFHLVYHMEDRPLPGYIVTVGKDGAKLVEAKDPTAAANCQAEQDKAIPGQYLLTCTSQTISQFLSSFGILPHPAIVHTGL